MRLRFFSDLRCEEHAVPWGFPESTDRFVALKEGLERKGFEIENPGTHPGAERAILAVHDERYVRRFKSTVDAGEHFLDTGDNPLSQGTWHAAKGAVDASLHAADWMLADRRRAAIAVVRPPGHHAERAMAMGFCYFNNIAVVAQYLLDAGDLDRVAIVDFDVHHGNGTQHLFEERSDVFYISLHQYPFYPGTGSAQERGRGPGDGATLNLPLPSGTGDAIYARAFQEVVLPALEAYKPAALLVSAGFDAAQTDPVGGMRVSTEAFGDWGRWLGCAAVELCNGRVLVTLEGGYDISALAAQLLSFCRGLEAAKARWS